MDDKKRAAYRAEVERKGKALKALRGERGISSQKPPCAYDKIQLRDWLASLRIEDEAERAAYLAAMLDHWFTGVFPEHLDGLGRTSRRTKTVSRTLEPIRSEKRGCSGTLG